ncbi:MAG: STAS domain-containing protein [Planctomycetes bacterium]|nr:STAS domain-containing protein [Planctomycetota bacterium]
MTSSSQGLRLLRRRAGGAVVLILEGNLDYESSAVLAQEVKDRIQEGVSTICLDLSRIHFLSSSGVASLVRVKRILEEKGGRLVLFDLSAEVKTVFGLTRVVDYFEIHSDEAGALAAVNGRCPETPGDPPAAKRGV